jgi:hypothetical protein
MEVNSNYEQNTGIWIEFKLKKNFFHFLPDLDCKQLQEQYLQHLFWAHFIAQPHYTIRKDVPYYI